MKRAAEIVQSPLSLPATLRWDNFVRAWGDARFASTLTNSALAHRYDDPPGLHHRIGDRLRARAQEGEGVEDGHRSTFWRPPPRRSNSSSSHSTSASPSLGLINNIFAVSLVYTAIYSPFAIMLLRTYFLAVPKELEEAALVDGAIALAGVHPGHAAHRVARHPHGGADHRALLVERVPDRHHLPAAAGPADGGGLVLPAFRAVLVRLGRDHGRGADHRHCPS